MKVTVVHVDIVSEEKNFMALLSWRQFAYVAVAGIIAYNIAKPILTENPTFDNFIYLFFGLFTPLTFFVYFFAFLYLETPDMYFDRWLIYWLLGKKENNIYVYTEGEDEE